MRGWSLGLTLLAVVAAISLFPCSQSARGGVTLHDWDTPEQLQEWMDAHIKVEVIVASDGTCDLTKSSTTLLGLPVETSICTDYAMRLSDLAMEDGYRLSLAVTDMEGDIGSIHVASEYHMGNLAVVGDSLYFVEPEKDTIVYISPLRK